MTVTLFKHFFLIMHVLNSHLCMPRSQLKREGPSDAGEPAKKQSNIANFFNKKIGWGVFFNYILNKVAVTNTIWPLV